MSSGYSGIAKTVGSLLLAGLMSLPRGNSTNYNSLLNDLSSTQLEYAQEVRPARSAYAQKVDSWFSQLTHTHGRYLPQGMMNLRTLNVSDDVLEVLAHGVYGNVLASMKPKNEEHDERFHIVQHKLPDGSYLWKDYSSGKELRATKVGSHYDFSGSNSLKFALGGRGELGTIMKMLEDDDPNHDMYAQKKAA